MASGVARSVAERIARIAGPAAIRVVLFGSHARGSAGPQSDLDLLLLLEPAVTSGWGPQRNVVEKHRVLGALGPITPRVDLWVRTVDQWAEAHGVIGGVEHAAAEGGVTVWERRPGRAPLPRLTEAQVRADNVRDWLRYATDLARAARSWPAGPPRQIPSQAPGPPLALRAAQSAATAACVRGGLPFPGKHATLAEVAAAIAHAVPDLWPAVQSALDAGRTDTERALRVVDLVRASLAPAAGSPTSQTP